MAVLLTLGGTACAPPPPTTEVAPVPIASAEPVSPPPAPVAVVPPVAAAPEAPMMEPLAEAPCRIRAGKSAPGTVRLTWKSARFATFETAREVELRVAGERATVAVATEDVEIVGEADPKSFLVVPIEEALIDGYFRPLRAHIERLSGEQATVRFSAPRQVMPEAPLSKTMPCAALSLGQRSRPEKLGTPMDLGDGLNAPLVTTPGGAVVAKVVTRPKPKPKRGGQATLSAELFRVGSAVLELGRKGGLVQVRILGDRGEAEGFLPASALRKPKPPMALLGALSGSGGRVEGRTDRRVRCTQAVPIYVRLSNEIVQIGRYKPNGLVVLPDPSADGAEQSGDSPLSSGELRITLGDLPTGIWGGLDDGVSGLGGLGLGSALGEGVAKPPPKQTPKPVTFVRAESIEACAVAAPPPKK